MALVEYAPASKAEPNRSARAFERIPAPRSRDRWGGCLGDWIGPGRAEGILETLHSYAEQCGAMARIELGPVRMLLVNQPALVREVLGHSLANRKGVLYQLTRPVFDSVLLQNGEQWLGHRRRFARAFAAVRPSAGLQQSLVEQSQAWAGIRGAVRLDTEILALVARICARMLHGELLPSQLEPARARIQHELAGVGLDLQCRPWSLANPSRWRRSHRACASLLDFHVGVVQRRREQARSQAAPNDALGALLAMVASGELPGDDRQIAHALLNMFFAAHEVLASSTFWCLYNLALHPELQQRVREGLVAGESEPLELTLKESLRLYPGYPLFTRTPASSIVLGGHRIPARTQIFVVPWVIHRMSEYWPDAERFDPSRWQTGEHASETYFPFGGGYRRCIGQALARPLMAGIVRHIVLNHRLRAQNPEGVGAKYWGTVLPRSGAYVFIDG